MFQTVISNYPKCIFNSLLTIATVHEVGQFHVTEAKSLSFSYPVLVSGVLGHDCSTSARTGKLKDTENLLSVYISTYLRLSPFLLPVLAG